MLKEPEYSERINGLYDLDSILKDLDLLNTLMIVITLSPEIIRSVAMSSLDQNQVSILELVESAQDSRFIGMLSTAIEIDKENRLK